jgi:hypothetical protein
MNEDTDDRPTGELQAESPDATTPQADNGGWASARPALDFGDSPVFRQMAELAREGIKHIP